MKRTAILLLLPLPLLLTLAGLRLEKAKGPHWLATNFDPDYVYLLNGANLAQGKPVGHFDHPGTPVQVLTAAVVRAAAAVSKPSGGDWRTDLLRHPEAYIRPSMITLIGLNAAMLFLMGLAALAACRSLGAALWLQAAPFLSITVLNHGLTRLTPEPMLFLAAMAMTAMALLESRPGRETGSSPAWLPLAAISGFGVACKITFLPLLIVPLALIPGWRSRLRFLVGAGAAFVFFTLPILFRYPRMAKWFINLTLHRGHYGSGSVGLPSASQILRNMLRLLAENRLFSLSLAVSLVIGLALVFSPPFRRRCDRRRLRLLAALALAQLAGLVFVAKHPANHYLLPELATAPATLLAAALIVVPLLPRPAAWTACLFGAVLIGVVLRPWLDFDAFCRQSEVYRDRSLELRAHLESLPDDAVRIFYYPSSAPEYALKFANDFSGYVHARRLQELYPKAFFYDIWRQRFTAYLDLPLPTLTAIRAGHPGPVVFQGAKPSPIPGLRLLVLYSNRTGEAIFAPSGEE